MTEDPDGTEGLTGSILKKPLTTPVSIGYIVPIFLSVHIIALLPADG